MTPSVVDAASRAVGRRRRRPDSPTTSSARCRSSTTAGRLVGSSATRISSCRRRGSTCPTFLNILGVSVPLPGQMSHLEEELHKVAGATVGEVMDDDPHTIGPDDTLEDLATPHARRTRSRTFPSSTPTACSSASSRAATSSGSSLGRRERRVTAHRPVWAEVDLAAIAENVRALRDGRGSGGGARRRQSRRLRPRRGPGQARRVDCGRLHARRRTRRGRRRAARRGDRCARPRAVGAGSRRGRDGRATAPDAGRVHRERDRCARQGGRRDRRTRAARRPSQDRHRHASRRLPAGGRARPRARTSPRTRSCGWRARCTHLAVADEPENPYTAEQSRGSTRCSPSCARTASIPASCTRATPPATLAVPAARYDWSASASASTASRPRPRSPARSRCARRCRSRRGCRSSRTVAGADALSYGLRYDDRARDPHRDRAHRLRRRGAARARAPRRATRSCAAAAVPIAGTITMDQLMLDVGDLPVEVGDEVVLLGRRATSRSRPPNGPSSSTRSPTRSCAASARACPRRYIG